MALPHLAWMNIEMDGVAKNTVSLDGPLEQIEGTLYEGSVCTIEGHRIVKNLTAALQKHLNGLILLNHWANKQRFKTGMDQNINWEMAEKAMLGLPKPKQRWAAKLAANFLPHGKNMKCWKLHMQLQSPRCPCLVEDKDHIIQCPAESAKAKWNKALTELDNWMEATKHTHSYDKILSLVYNDGMTRHW